QPLVRPGYVGRSVYLQPLFAGRGDASSGPCLVIASVHRNRLGSVPPHPIENLLSPFHEGRRVGLPLLAFVSTWIEAQVRRGQFILGAELPAVVPYKWRTHRIDRVSLDLRPADDSMNALDDFSKLDERHLSAALSNFVREDCRLSDVFPERKVNSNHVICNNLVCETVKERGDGQRLVSGLPWVIVHSTSPNVTGFLQVGDEGCLLVRKLCERHNRRHRPFTSP